MKNENKINSILKEILKENKPSKEDLEKINFHLDEFLKKLEKKLEELKINAEIFVGGSLAKGTLIKKKNYDIDIFVRFQKNERYKKEMPNLLYKVLKNFKDVSLIHGSRDYFNVKKGGIFFEVIPVIKIKNQKEAENITDLSFFHVKYIKRKLTKKILDDVILAKAFCFANSCYGAESYINGFSGYALELLIYHYKSFLRFIKAMTKVKDKIIIDIKKYYKNKQEIMMNLNTNKLKSPIILIDPTYKERNALAALSEETFEKFKKACKEFLKNPNKEAFEIKEFDLGRIKKNAKRKKYEFILLEAKTNKQEGDIAGSKLLKFFKFLSQEIEKFFVIKNKGFDYNEKQSAKYFFVDKRKKEILIPGPLLKDEINVKKFKEKHKNIFEKAGKVYSREKINFDIKEFISDWKNKNKEKLKGMSIEELKIIE